MKGSIIVALALFILFFPIGILYAIFMSTGNTNVCPKCKNTTMIPEDTERGKYILKKKNAVS